MRRFWQLGSSDILIRTLKNGVTCLVLGIVLEGCSGAGLPSGDPTAVQYKGSDAATLTIFAVDEGCCFIEGSLHFAHLEGPTSVAWGIDQPLPLPSAFDPDAPREVGSHSFGIRPGEYRATFSQRPCDANCGNLDPIVSQCSVAFTAKPTEHLRIDVSFPLEKQCTASITP